MIVGNKPTGNIHRLGEFQFSLKLCIIAREFINLSRSIEYGIFGEGSHILTNQRRKASFSRF